MIATYLAESVAYRMRYAVELPKIEIERHEDGVIVRAKSGTLTYEAPYHIQMPLGEIAAQFAKEVAQAWGRKLEAEKWAVPSV